MAFGDNVLSKDATDWSIVSGAMVSGTLMLNAGGTATQILSKAEVLSIPDEFYISIIASRYTSSYAPTAFVTIRFNTTTNFFEYSVPLVDTGNGYCNIYVPVVETEYVSLTFTIHTSYALTITDWLLSVPVLDSADLDSLREEIPKILDDYNTAIFTIGQVETTIGFITADVLQNTDMNGHFLLTYIANSAAVLTIRIKDNDITELYTPILYNLVPGRNSIGIPHAYVRKLVGIHTFTVTAQVDTGTVSIITRGMLFTVDGGHMAKRLIDIDVNITDMTIRQIITEVEPSLVYAVGIEDGMARVRCRSFKGDATLVWEPTYEVGPAIDAAVEFNGVWVERSTDLGYTIITEILPWIFWIDPDNVLYGQYGTDTSTKVTLATGVSSVSAVRGFKSSTVLTNDQGLVVVYIKDGNVYYRSYATQDTGDDMWELETAISAAGTGVTSAFIVRLNDYRLALSITGASGNKLLYTNRVFAGQAFKSDRAKVVDTFLPNILLQPITFYNEVEEEHIEVADAGISMQFGASASGLTTPLLTYFEADASSKDIQMVFDCDFYGIDTIDPSTVVVTPANTLLSIEYIGAHHLRMVFANAVNTAGAISLTFSAALHAGFYRGGASWFSNEIWTIAFAVNVTDAKVEIVQVADVTIPTFQFAATTDRPGYLDEQAKIIDTNVAGIELYSINTEPI